MAPQSDQSAQTAPKRPTKPSEVERITVEELKAKLAKGEPLTILDVRVGPSYEASDQTIKGAIRIAPDEIEKHLSELPKDREIVTFCT
jgi:rhodanese-related sulfurtransferase